MRVVIPPDGGPYPYAGTGYADPDAVTQIANGLSTTTFTYDAENGRWHDYNICLRLCKPLDRARRPRRNYDVRL